MIDPTHFSEFFSAKICSGIFGVPDSLLKEVSLELEKLTNIPRVTACHEGSAVGLAVGSYLATGKPALVYMQNSGLGNAVNPLVALADRSVYGIPMVLLIGWRGQPGRPDEPQHTKQGRITEKMLELMEIPHFLLPKTTSESLALLKHAFALSIETSGPVAVLVEKGSFAKSASPSLGAELTGDSRLTREDAMKIVHAHTNSNEKIVATTGMLGRELEEFQASLTAPEVPGTFLVVGGMGHASSVALGMALSSPGLRIWCLDGDGAMLMHLGAVPVIADSKPNDFIHVVFDNGAHDSVGGQPTPLRTSSLEKIAMAAGYEYAGVASSKAEVEAELGVILEQTGPRLLVIKIKPGSRVDLGRPKKSPEAAKTILMGTF